MKQANFLNTKNKEKNKIIFELVERLYYEGEKVLIYCKSEERASELDRFLWTYKQESFIPHRIFHYEEAEAPEIIAIVTEEINPIGADSIIVDEKCRLDFSQQFKKIYEFIEQSKEDIIDSRKRYKFYKDNGFIMHYEE